MAKDFDDDFLNLDMFDDDDLLLLDVEDEDDFEDPFPSGKKSAASGKQKAAKKTGRQNDDYSGGKGPKVVLVILIVLVALIAVALFALQMSGGDLTNLLPWKAKTEQTQPSNPVESTPAVSEQVVTTPDPQPSETPDETTPAVSETPEVSEEPDAVWNGEGLALMQTVPASFEQKLVGVDNLGNVQDGGNHQVDTTIAAALKDFIAAARAEGYGTMLSTCYKEEVSERDELDVQEHGTGLAVDIVDVEAQVKAAFAQECTEEIQWLVENAPKYGFILRFPEGKEDKTGMEYLPYHFVYVGTTVAKDMAEHDWCLEEYLAQ